jgi:hypothetical protein
MSKNFIPSFQQAISTNHVTRPYLFFHIPKSAGMGLTAGFGSCYERAQVSLSYRPWHGRVDDPKGHKDQHVINAVKEYIEINGVDKVGGFVASHKPIVVLEEAGIEFKMVTVLRRTEDRVLSAFNYDCMRCNQEPTAVRLQAFIHLPNQQNVSVKTLLGIESISGGEADIAENLLKEYFYAYCFIEDINLMISAILSLEGLPNLQLGQENKTIDTFRYQPSQAELEQIKQLNQEDESLIELLGYGSLKLPEFDKSFGMSQSVVKVMSRQTSEKYGYYSKIFKLSQLEAS